MSVYQRVWLKRAATWASLLPMFFFCAGTRAQSTGLQVRPADAELLIQAPRQVVTASFVVRNDTGRRVQVEPRLVLPSDWRAITADFPFDLDNGQSVVRLTSFVIPDAVRAGEYTVTYETRDRQQPTIRAAYAIRVRIVASPKLEVLALEAPAFAIAGLSYQAEFLVRNTGNVPIHAVFTTRSAYGSEVSPATGKLSLEPGEAKNVPIDIVASNLRRRADERLTMLVEAPGTSVRESATAAMQIVSRVSSGDAYHTLDTRMEVSFLARDKDSVRTSGWQGALSGAGALDERGERRVGFYMRAPDMRDVASLGVMDEYWIDYKDRNVVATVGDYLYELSWLTEPFRYGRGARLGLQTDRWGAAALQSRDRFSVTDYEQLGFNGYYLPTDQTRLDINLLDTNGGRFPSTVGSVRSRTEWDGGLNTDVELGQSNGGNENGRAFRGSIYDSRHTIGYYVTGWRADPEYRGYLRDEEYLTLGFDFLRRNGWGLYGYYRLQNRNLNDDPARPAPDERHFNLSVMRTVFESTRLTLEGNLRTYTDSSARSLADSENRAMRVGVTQSWRTFSLSGSVSGGETNNRISGQRSESEQQTLSAYWRPTSTQTYGLYASRADNFNPVERRQSGQTAFGANANYALRSATYVALDVQRSESRSYDYRYYNLSLRHTLRNDHRLTLTARRIEGYSPQTDVMLTYSIPFALPIFRKPNVSSVHGRVYDAETGGGVRNVVLNLDGLTAVSDANGEFEFPVVEAGAHKLSVDRSNVDVGKVPLDNLPSDVTVTPKTPKQIDVALIRSVTINLGVTMPDDGADNRSPFSTRPTATGGVANVLVTLANGDRIYRRVTDSGGRVRFAGLPPGRWIASIAADAVPQNYQAESRELVLDVLPGSVATAGFVLQPVARNIRMQEPLGLLK